MNSLITNNESSNFYNYLIKELRVCDSFIFNVAFINYSGIQLLLDTFKYCEEKGIKGKILTSTYLGFTQAKALEKLLQFKNIELKIYENSNRGFHSKAYIFQTKNCFDIVIGSSNITSSALKSNIEWNLQTKVDKDNLFYKDVNKEFEKLWEESIFVDEKFISEYKEFQRKIQFQNEFKFDTNIKANLMQKEALDKLEFLRQKGENKALVVAATGTGKTYLAALDVKNVNPSKVLFVVHRENILINAKKSFEKILDKKIDNNHFFITVQTLSNSFVNYKKDEFDYIIIDEAHHISSPSYKKIYNYFEPKFLLGLTATPNRMDKENIYKFFDDNVACDIKLSHAIDEKLVVPFHYYGITEINEIDYSGIDLNDIKRVSKLLMLNKRVDYIIEKLEFYNHSSSKRKCLGFCISKEHARYMSDEFNKRGIKSIALSSEDKVSKREEIIKRVSDDNDDLEMIFSVDIFNEGIDIPEINTVLMLRPTQSPVVFIQQLGRGLRKSKNKEFLTILDFIGNHNRAYQIVYALLGDKLIDKDSVKLSVENNFANIKNAHIVMDEITKTRILEQIDNENFNSFKYLKEKYIEFKINLGREPKLVDYISFSDIINPLDFVDESKSYFEFVKRVEKDKYTNIKYEDESFLKTIRFIDSMLPINRVYEFAILKYLILNDFCTIKEIKIFLKKYLSVIDENTIIHSFNFLSQQYFDSSQKSKYENIVKYTNGKLIKSSEFIKVLSDKDYKAIILDSLNNGLITYEERFDIKDYGLPFLKPYEKYNMLNVALLSNFDKIHSSFRGSGFLKFKDDFFLFLTIEKQNYIKASKYENIFLDKSSFTYFSKPSHTQNKGDGYRLINNKEESVKLHIFVRKSSKIDNKTQKFIYLGLANTISFEGNKPIKTILKLENELSDNLFEEFTKVI